jgi:hypothetical protein
MVPKAASLSFCLGQGNGVLVRTISSPHDTKLVMGWCTLALNPEHLTSPAVPLQPLCVCRYEKMNAIFSYEGLWAVSDSWEGRHQSRTGSGITIRSPRLCSLLQLPTHINSAEAPALLTGTRIYPFHKIQGDLEDLQLPGLLFGVNAE